MVKHMVKCTYCNQVFDRNVEEAINDPANSRRYIHVSCLNQRRSAISKEEQDKEDLIYYIKQLLGPQYAAAKVDRQITDYHRTYGYQYSGMLGTLKFFYEIQKNTIDKANGGVGIIPFVYEQAKEYYRKINAAQNANSVAAIQKYHNEVEEIRIAPPHVKVKEPYLFNLDGEDVNE